MNRKIAHYGWIVDHLDQRDEISRAQAPAPLPRKVDLRHNCPPVYDQGQLGSCTANAIAAAVDFERRVQGEPFMTPSRLFIYYNERVIEGDPAQDNGAEIRDGIKSVASQGVCPESVWAYSDKGTRFAMKPNPQCYTDALKFKTLKYQRVVQMENPIKSILALGKPVVFGFSVFEAFESDAVAKSGIVPMPGTNDAPIGGHAVCAVGYDDSVSRWICRNSWGPDWGQAGYFQMPYAYLLNPQLASDLWVIQAEE